MNCGEYAMSDPNPYVDPPNPGATPNYSAFTTQETYNSKMTTTTPSSRPNMRPTSLYGLTMRSSTASSKKRLIKLSPTHTSLPLALANVALAIVLSKIFFDLYDWYGTVMLADIKNLTLNI